MCPLSSSFFFFLGLLMEPPNEHGLARPKWVQYSDAARNEPNGGYTCRVWSHEWPRNIYIFRFQSSCSFLPLPLHFTERHSSAHLLWFRLKNLKKNQNMSG
ncbi:hypothetical protein ACOSQ3_025105 [Xanthoceras sorbifolium]